MKLCPLILKMKLIIYPISGKIREMEEVKENANWDARRIRSLRRYLKLTQAEMAAELGTRQQTVSEWETGLHQATGTSIKMLSIIADRSAFRYKAK